MTNQIIILSMIIFLIILIFILTCTPSHKCIIIKPTKNDIYNQVHEVMNNFWFNMNDIDRRLWGGPLQYLNTFRNMTFWESFYLCNFLIPAAARRLLKINDIPWKIVIMRGDSHIPMPHTMGDIIVLTDNFFKLSQTRQIELLVHEKIHVFQRRAQPIFEKFYNTIGFTKYQDVLPPEIRRICRANPDINDYYIYNQKLLIKLYNSPNSCEMTDAYTCLIDLETLKINKDISELNLPPWINDTEHPNEIFAATIASSEFNF